MTNLLQVNHQQSNPMCPYGKALREELLNIPRMTRSHIYIVDEEEQEVLGRDKALQDLVEQGAGMDTEVVQDNIGTAFTVYTVNRTPPRPILAPGPQGTAMRVAAAAVISALISFFLARSLATPLEHMRRASRGIAAGELATRVGQEIGNRKDEIGQLATDFDEMASRLQAMQAANQRLLQDVSHELRSPITALTAAIEVLDARRDAGPLRDERAVRRRRGR